MLGGFTTFSTYAVDIQQSISAGATRVALLYLVGTVTAAMLAVWTGVGLTSAAIRNLRRRAHDRKDGRSR